MEEKKERQKRTNSRAGKFVAGAYKNLGPSFSLSLIAPRELSVPMLLHPGSRYLLPRWPCEASQVKWLQNITNNTCEYSHGAWAT